MLNLSWQEVQDRARVVCKRIVQSGAYPVRIYGVPRGGFYPALLIAGLRNQEYTELVDNAAQATIFVDDIIDSGKTQCKYRELYPGIPFFAIVNKCAESLDGKWIVFPWERMAHENGPEENVRRLLEYIGENPDREGLKETPNRVIRSYNELFSGYEQDPKNVMKVFKDGACDELVLLKDIPFYSTCEHHMLPFYGKAHIAYIPNGKVIGVSKLARILEIYSRRLQIQERIGQQVTDCIMQYLQPKGAACVLAASHNCMTCRGVQKSNSVMITSSLQGLFLTNAQTRSEFLSMIKG